MGTTPLKVMSFNVRWATESPSSGNAYEKWSVRRPILNNLLEAQAPHLIGTQEGLRTPIAQLDNIIADLGPTWALYGVGRDSGTTAGEHMAILYDTRRLALLTGGNFWLSGTPTTAGSNTLGLQYVRMCTWARFRDRLTGRTFYHYNTHIDFNDHPGQVAVITAQIAARSVTTDPVIITGDMNTPGTAGNDTWDAFYDAGFRDSWFTADVTGTKYGTFNGYATPSTSGNRIDWILGSPSWHWSTAAIDTYNEGGTAWASDHMPVVSTMDLEVPNPKTLKLIRSTNLSIANSTTTPTEIPWSSVEVNTGPSSWWSSGAASQIVMPYAGPYLVTMQTCWATDANVARRHMRLSKTTTVSDANTVLATAWPNPASGEPARHGTHTQVINVATAGDIYKMTAMQNSGAALNLTAGVNSAIQPASISITYLGD